MNLIEMQYKADTGNSSKIGFEIEPITKRGLILIDSDIEYEFDLSENILELHKPEYVKWLEEKVETLQKSKP